MTAAAAKTRQNVLSRLAPHLLAGTLAMVFAYRVAFSPYVQSGLQFVGPALVIVLTHISWLALRGEVQSGYAQRVFARAAKTCLFFLLVLFLGATFAPMPSQAGNDILSSAFAVLFCLFIIGVVAVVITFAIAITLFILRTLFDLAFKNRDKDTLNDAGGLLLGVGLLVLMSLEGVPWGYAFSGKGEAGATRIIAAAPAQVWQTLKTTTSPVVPLPTALSLFPQPIDVPVDEGMGLGARRVVTIMGRPGTGDLALKVTQRSDSHAVLTVQSDESPMAVWLAFKTLRYDIAAHPEGTALTISLAYDRLLAPAWIFDPMMTAAATLAMGVLAQDAKERAETDITSPAPIGAIGA